MIHTRWIYSYMFIINHKFIHNPTWFHHRLCLDSHARFGSPDPSLNGQICRIMDFFGGDPQKWVTRLIYGKYMVNIWLLYGLYLVNNNLVGGAITILKHMKHMSSSMGRMTTHIWNGKYIKKSSKPIRLCLWIGYDWCWLQFLWVLSWKVSVLTYWNHSLYLYLYIYDIYCIYIYICRIIYNYYKISIIITIISYHYAPAP